MVLSEELEPSSMISKGRPEMLRVRLFVSYFTIKYHTKNLSIPLFVSILATSSHQTILDNTNTKKYNKKQPICKNLAFFLQKFVAV